MKRYLFLLIFLLFASVASCQTLNQQHVGMYDALQHGATCDSNTLNAAIAASASANKQLVVGPTDRLMVACDWDISSAVSVPANRHLFVPPGAMLTKVGAGTLTLDSCPLAGRYQIFNNFATGLTLRCENTYPEWWGTGPTTFQNALDAMTVNGGELTLDRVTYTQNSMTAKSNVTIKGKGVGRTKVVLANTQNTWLYGNESNSSNVIDDMVMYCGMSDMEIDGNAANNTPGPSGQGAISPRGFSFCTFRNLYIHNTYSDSIGSLLRTRDSLIENVHMETSGRACISSTGGTLRNTFRNLTCISPFNSCFDIEPANNVSALYNAHYSFNVVDGLNCVTPTQNGLSSTWGSTIAASFTGTREHNRFVNISIKQPGNHGVIVGDLNNSVLENISVVAPGTGYGIWVGGYSSLGTTGVTLNNCIVRSAPSGVFGIYVSDGDAPGVVSDVAITGCVVSASVTADLRIDAVQNVSVAGVSTTGIISIAGAARPISIGTQGQGPDLASTNTMHPLGLYSSYIVTGGTTLLEFTTSSLWHGREITLTFDTALTLVEHDSEISGTPIYLANQGDAYFCAGDTLRLRMSDQSSGETRMQETGRSRAVNAITYTTGTTPPVGCATSIVLAHTTGENITDFTNGEQGIDYTFRCTTNNAVLKELAQSGNFNLAGTTDFGCTAGDIIVLRKPLGQTIWHEVSRSVN